MKCEVGDYFALFSICEVLLGKGSSILLDSRFYVGYNMTYRNQVNREKR